jgi:hypothetical protein
MVSSRDTMDCIKLEEPRMYNSPTYFCHACKRYVALDQTKEECAKGRKCTVNPCPLAPLFTQRDGPPESEDPRDIKARFSYP